MANITTHQHFVGDINIPNADPTKVGEGGLTVFINKYEPKLLSECLGYKMYTDMKQAFDAGAVSGVWFNLFAGAKYTDKYGRANNWPGFTAVGFNLIANYVYCNWMENSATYTTGGGEKKTKSTNADNTNGVVKMVNAWNQMVELLFVMDDFIVQNAADYPDYIGRQQWCAEYGNENYYEKTNVFGL
jgi:hypothetical protein